MTIFIESSAQRCANKYRSILPIHIFRRLLALLVIVGSMTAVPMQMAKASTALSTSQSVLDHNSSTPMINIRTDRWYVGGTLHRATYGQWSRGTPRDQLATASDWAVKILGEPRVMQIGMDGLKVYAANLVTCVNAAGTRSVMNHPVTELVAACSVLLGM